jgi:NADPH-dependent 2,4-dienoyl-CoA reductase/sulfur reductase-like enzyme
VEGRTPRGLLKVLGTAADPAGDTEVKLAVELFVVVSSRSGSPWATIWREAVVPRTHECDVLVIGSGAGGFASAITARKAGLDVFMVEKANVFGGTTATSGGIIWIPANPMATRSGVS